MVGRCELLMENHGSACPHYSNTVKYNQVWERIRTKIAASWRGRQFAKQKVNHKCKTDWVHGWKLIENGGITFGTN